jgi:hypothetical protein
LNDLLGFSEEEMSRTRVKFNTYNGETDPLTLFMEGDKALKERLHKNWLYHVGERDNLKNADIAICLVKIRGNHWLLTTVDDFKKDENGEYTGIPKEKYEQYFGRTIIEYTLTGRTIVRHFDRYAAELKVRQILPGKYDNDDFPGYDNVKLSYSDLKRVIARKDWIAALGNQKAVYLITDKKTGKLYVGSATGEEMLLQRWSQYVADGHGGNIELKKLQFEHIQKHFQYSILENYNGRVDDDIVRKRERWWKEVLQSRDYGYNAN